MTGAPAVRLIDICVVACFFLADLLAARMWSQFVNLKDTELHRLELEVSDTLLSGKADSTTRKYSGAFQIWKLWAEAEGLVLSI